MSINEWSVSRRQLVTLLGASAGAATLPAWAEKTKRLAPTSSPSVRFLPAERSIGDVMPFYHNGEYHMFYLLNATSNDNINWEHAVSTDLIHWKHLPPAIRFDPNDKLGPEGGCMFTGSIVSRDGIFHAFYTSWNPHNPKGREFICHATSTDLITWTKHPADMIAPDGVHYANHQARDFRDPCVVWDEERGQYIMYINANKPGNSNFVYGILTSLDLKHWTQKLPIEEIPGDECPDFFKAGDTYYMHGCNVYAFARHKDGPWQFPTYNKIDRRMAAKRVFDGKRHVWFGGWLHGPMSIPREVYEGPDGLLFAKPVDEIVNVFKDVYLSQGDLRISAGKSWRSEVPQDYLLEATIAANGNNGISLVVRDEEKTFPHRIALSPRQGAVLAIGVDSAESREIPLDFTRPVSMRAFIIGGVAEIFFNSQYAATFLIGNKGGALNIQAEGDVMFKELQIKVLGRT